MKQIYFTLAFVLCLLAGSAQLSGYSYIKPITVSNTSTSTAINYQLKLSINTQSLISASQMLSSGADIRFGKTCNGSSLYNYWIESGINTANTVIWIKIDTLLAGTTRTFFMFYGNSLATGSSALSGVFIGPNSSTDSISGANSGGVINSQRGFRFSPNEDLLVSAFGRNEPNGSTRYVTLFDNATQTIVAQTTVSGPAGQYSYNNLVNPFWITQGTQYLLELFQGGSDGYYFGAAPQVGQHITYYDMRYCNGCTQNTFPTNSLGGMHYGYPDLWYWTKTTITPAPTYTIDQVPSISVAQSAASVCPLAGVSFTASANMPLTTFTWLPSNTTTAVLNSNPSATTVYTVNGTSQSCSYLMVKTVTITTHPIPSISITGNTPICGTGTDLLTASGASTYTWNTAAQTATISVSPSSTANYSLTGTSALGCTNTAFATVTVNPLPSVSIAGGNIAICSGNSASLGASGAATYSWNTTAATASISVSPAATSGYSVIGTSAVGCTNSAVTSITVNITPTVAIAVGNATICPGVSASFTASGASTYSWNTTAVTASVSVSPLTTSSYSVIGTSAQGCTATALTTLTVYATPTVVVTAAQASLCSGNTTSLTASGASTYSWNTTATTSVIAVSPALTSTYNVVGTSSEGCTNTAVFIVTVYSTPTVSIAGGGLTICSGNSLSLTASGAPALFWSSGQATPSIVVVPGSSMDYSVIGTSIEGCTNMAVTSISVNLTPTVQITAPNSTLCSGHATGLSASGASTYSWTTGASSASISVSPSLTTSYTVTGTSSSNCSSTAVFNITVFVTPTISIAAGSATVCAGSPVTLTASGAATYSWSTLDNTATLTINPTSNTSYTATGISTDGCVGTAVKTVSVHPLPVINASSNFSIICVGETATLSVSGSDTYSWSSSELTAEIVVTPSATTVYYVTGTSSLTGCSTTASVTQEVAECTGISKSNTDHLVKIYPNPTHGKLTLELNESGKVFVTNVVGQVVYAQMHVKGVSEISIAQLENGVYVVGVESESCSYKVKVIKE